MSLKSLNIQVEVGGARVPPTVSEQQVWDPLVKVNSHKSMRPDDMHPRILRELTDVANHSPLYLKSWKSGKVPVTGEGNITLVFEKGIKEDPWNYRSISLPFLPGKIMEQILMKVMLSLTQDKEVI
ncbi:RNA-directed DNA polymerase from mobile element jockey [Pitangus sulphuratus]|nr:RNA-directed DNA polymerase from mobile element jockey [Pitangus sulphuratus]